MTLPYLTVTTVGGSPRIAVLLPGADKADRYPLTPDGAKAAGAALHAAGYGKWFYGSACDFPQDYGVDIDVRALVSEGFVTANAAGDA